MIFMRRKKKKKALGPPLYCICRSELRWKRYTTFENLYQLGVLEREGLAFSQTSKAID
jgi:hypothetical protein